MMLCDLNRFMKHSVFDFQTENLKNQNSENQNTARLYIFENHHVFLENVICNALHNVSYDVVPFE